MFFPPWNVSSNAESFHRADAFVVSVPKSGRTWLRVFLSKYLAELQERHKAAYEQSPVKKIKYTHDLWEHRVTPHWYERIRGKWLIPPSERRKKPKIVMVRDPRDLIVSLYFQLSRRSLEFSGTLSELLTDEIFGVEKVVDTMNRFYTEWHALDNHTMIRYEDARKNDADEFHKILIFLNIPVYEDIFQESLGYSAFDNMKKIEKNGNIDKKLSSDIHTDALLPGESLDPESFKVRKGKVGGYREYMSEGDLVVMAEAMKKLNPCFGYSFE